MLQRVLKGCAGKIREGRRVQDVLAQGRDVLERAGFAVDYFEARNAETLQPVASRRKGPLRLLAAAKIGQTRLIDNVAV